MASNQPPKSRPTKLAAATNATARAAACGSTRTFTKPERCPNPPNPAANAPVKAAVTAKKKQQRTRLVQEADADKSDHGNTSAHNDDDPSVNAVDQISGDQTSDACGDKENARGNAGERNRECTFCYKRIEQNGKIVKDQARRES